MSRGRKTTAKQQTLSEYIQQKVFEKKLTHQAAALAMGISNSYLSDIINNKAKNPSAEICKTIANFFGDPPSYVLRLAGLIDRDTSDEIAVEIAEALDRDPILKEMYEVYTQLKSPEEKRAMLRAIRIFASGDGE